MSQSFTNITVVFAHRNFNAVQVNLESLKLPNVNLEENTQIIQTITAKIFILTTNHNILGMKKASGRALLI
jgi:hypothetical protein